MTPRLKKLLIGFAISLVILIADRVSESSGSSTTTRVEKKQQKRKRPSTARVGANRAKRVAAEVAAAEKRAAPKDFTPSQEFIPIPEEVLTLASWGRNPFTDREPTPVRQVQVNQPVKSGFIQEQVIVSNVNTLKIESVATLGDKTFVIINGQRFQEGDKINNMVIETIESQRIILNTGTKKIVKNVGS